MEDIGYLNIKGQTKAIADHTARKTAEETKTELTKKVDKVTGKGLSTKDFTADLDELKIYVRGLQSADQVNAVYYGMTI